RSGSGSFRKSENPPSPNPAYGTTGRYQTSRYQTGADCQHPSMQIKDWQRHADISLLTHHPNPYFKKDRMTREEWYQLERCDRIERIDDPEKVYQVGAAGVAKRTQIGAPSLASGMHCVSPAFVGGFDGCF